MKSNKSTIIIILGAVLLVLILFIAIYLRRREIAFEGEVIDKNMTETPIQANNIMDNQPGNIVITRGGVQASYSVKVKIESGKTINYPISSGLYEVIKIGDRVSKPKGTTTLTILNKTQDSVDDNSSQNTVIQ